MRQEYYLAKADWEDNSLQVSLHKLGLPYSKPEDPTIVSEEVLSDERRDRVYKQGTHSYKLKQLAGLPFKDFIV